MSLLGRVALGVTLLPAALGAQSERLPPGWRAEWEARFRSGVSAESLSRIHQPLARVPHVAGTPASLAIADHLAATLRRYGLEVAVHDYEPWLSHPRRVSVEMTAPTRRRFSLVEARTARYPTSGDPLVGPAFIAYSASGTVTAPAVYVNYGLPPDYAALAGSGVEVRGKVVIARYGRSHRAVKVAMAQGAGAAALILYSDPADDGAAKGAVWPAGYWRNEHLIQRGNAKLSWFWHGDPLTPGAAATANAKRLDPAMAPTLPRIPVVAVSSRDARLVLQALGGGDVPAGFAGALPVRYRTGPGPARVHLSVDMNDGPRPIRNIVATIRGAVEPDRTVMFGTHHDAWTFGAVDPGTGAAVLLETARGLAYLTKTGWRPRRSISFAFWDAEEYGLVGSTEYAEESRERLQRELVAYINTDMNLAGRFDPGGVPSLRDFVAEVTRDVAEGKSTVFDGWRRNAWQRLPADQRRGEESDFEPGLKPLGSGADFVPFQDHLGVPTLSLEFVGENGYGYGTYHSNADSRAYLERFADPGFRQGVVLARVLGTAAVRLGDAPVLPFRFSSYATALDRAVRAANEWIAASGLTGLGLETHAALVARVERAARRLEAAMDSSAAAGLFAEQRVRRLNDGLARLEQLLTDDEGPADSKWYRHVVYGWNVYSLYDGQPFPGLFEALRVRNLERAAVEVERLRGALGRMAVALEELVAGG